MGMIIGERERERARCLLSMEERTASAATVCLNLDLVLVGVPVGRFLLVAVNDVRAVCPWLGTVCPRAGVILLVSGFSNLIHPCIPAGLEMVCT